MGARPRLYRGLEKTHRGRQYQAIFVFSFFNLLFGVGAPAVRQPCDWCSDPKECVEKWEKKESTWYWRPLYDFSKPVYRFRKIMVKNHDGLCAIPAHRNHVFDLYPTLVVQEKNLYNQGRASTVRPLYDETHSHGLDSDRILQRP